MNGLIIFILVFIVSFIVMVYYKNLKESKEKVKEIESNLKNHYNYKSNKDYVKNIKNKS